jgi:predicted dehydrogenase
MSIPFRFAIVGSGNISSAYIQSIGNLPDVELVALVSRSGRRPEDLPANVPVCPSLSQVDRPFDSVILATPNGLHCQGAIKASGLGKHVLTEKVLDISREAMDRMTEACEQAGVKLGVAFQRRMSPDNVAIKKLVEAGTFGRIFAADMQVKFYRDQAYYDSAPYRGGYEVDGGGAFIQQAAHNADLLCWLFGMPDKVVSMLGTFDHDIEAEDHGTALFHYPDGMIGTFCASTVCRPGYPTRLEMHAEAGSVVMENDQITTWSVDGVDNPSAADFDVHDGATSAAVSDTAGHEAIIRDFVQAVREDRDPAVPPASGRLATELVLQIYENNLLAQ